MESGAPTAPAPVLAPPAAAAAEAELPEAEEKLLAAASAVKTNGNALFKHKVWVDASLKYKAAIDMLRPSESTAGKELLLDCLLNRAACYIRMERFGSATKDCSEVLQHDSLRVKAWFRRGEARYCMHQAHEAREDLAEALRLEPGNEQVRSLFNKAVKSAGNTESNAYWLQNFDFSTGTFCPTLPKYKRTHTHARTFSLSRPRDDLPWVRRQIQADSAGREAARRPILPGERALRTVPACMVASHSCPIACRHRSLRALANVGGVEGRPGHSCGPG